MKTDITIEEHVHFFFEMLVITLEHFDLTYDEIRSIVGDELINRLNYFVPFSTDEADEN